MDDNTNDKNTGIVKIKVVGVGGGGGNAVNRMVDAGISSAEFVVVNTDKQALLMFDTRKCETLQIGEKLTNGLGAGADPKKGEMAAEESKEMLKKMLDGVDLLFITAGMGGGTGTGAAPVIASLSREMGILTVAIVTKPFAFEGSRRMNNAMKGIEKLKEYVDALLIVPNDKLMQVLPKNTPIVQAFKEADEVLRKGIQGISDLIATPSLINLDFADVKNIIKGPCSAHLGVGEGEGENRAITAVQQAVKSPLLETSIVGASGVILNIMGGLDMTLEEVDIASNLVHSVVDEGANIIIGAGIDSSLQGKILITLIATGGIKDAVGGNNVDAGIENTLGRLRNRNFEKDDNVYVPLGELNKKPMERPMPNMSRPVEQSKNDEDDNMPAFIRKLKANRGNN
ncbi:MAG: cell division protein FtsZ [Clostridia bacterium]|nr:cell division protein FtsZ [Clostridia bacterium]